MMYQGEYGVDNNFGHNWQWLHKNGSAEIFRIKQQQKAIWMKNFLKKADHQKFHQAKNCWRQTKSSAMCSDHVKTRRRVVKTVLYTCVQLKTNYIPEESTAKNSSELSYRARFEHWRRNILLNRRHWEILCVCSREQKHHHHQEDEKKEKKMHFVH